MSEQSTSTFLALIQQSDPLIEKFKLFLKEYNFLYISKQRFLIFLDAYVNYPKIINNSNIDPFNDVLTGNLFSQFGVSSSALLLTVLQKPFYWHVVVAFLYCVLALSRDL